MALLKLLGWLHIEPGLLSRHLLRLRLPLSWLRSGLPESWLLSCWLLPKVSKTSLLGWGLLLILLLLNVVETCEPTLLLLLLGCNIAKTWLRLLLRLWWLLLHIVEIRKASLLLGWLLLGRLLLLAKIGKPGLGLGLLLLLRCLLAVKITKPRLLLRGLLLLLLLRRRGLLLVEIDKPSRRLLLRRWLLLLVEIGKPSLLLRWLLLLLRRRLCVWKVGKTLLLCRLLRREIAKSVLLLCLLLWRRLLLLSGKVCKIAKVVVAGLRLCRWLLLLARLRRTKVGWEGTLLILVASSKGIPRRVLACWRSGGGSRKPE